MKILSYITLPIIGIVIGALVMRAFTSANTSDTSALKDAAKREQLDIKRIEILEKMLTERDTLYTRIRRKDRDSLAIERKQRLNYEIQYKRLKETPLPRYSDPELDSIVWALTDYR